MTAGSVASVAMPMGKMHKRTEEAANPAQQAAIAVNMKKAGKKPKKVSEGAVKQIMMDLKDLTDKEFVAKYKKSKAEAKKELKVNESLRDGEYYTFKVFFDDGSDETLNFSSDDINWDRVGAKRDKKVVDVKRLGGIQGSQSDSPRKPHDFPDDRGLARAQRAYDRQLPEGVAEGSFGSGYGSMFTLYVNTGEKPTTKTKTKKFKREDDAVLWAEDYADQHEMFPNLKMEIQDKNGNVVWELEESQGVDEDWQKANRKDKTSGMSRKAVKAYRRENPGSKLKTAVTTKPSKLKPGSKAAKRRKSFCARMSGNKGPMKKPNGKPTPKALALRRWNCESVEDMRSLVEAAEKFIAEKQRLDPKCWTGYKKQGTKMKGGVRVNNCVPVEETKPGLYANVNAKRERIKHGSGERMRKPGTKGAPSAQAWRDAAKTAKTESNIMRGMLEAALSEEEILLAPGQGIKYRTELMPKRTDHEVEMARNQLRSSFENAKDIYQSIKDLSEIQGLDGWVQAKITKASDYLEAVNQYLEGKKQMIEKEVEVAEETMSAAAGETNQTFGPGGMSQTIGSGGDITTRSDIGGTSVSQTKTPGGYTKQTTAGMDMGNAGSASMVQQAPQQPGQLAGTTTVTRTAAAGPKYDADAGIAANTPSAQPVTGSAVRGVAFGGASGANVGNNVVTTGNTALAQQAKRLMPGSNKQQGLGEDEIEDRLTAQYNTPQMKAQSQRVDQAFASGDQAEFDRMGILSPQQIEKDYQTMLAKEPEQDAALMRNPKLTPSARPAQRYNPKGVPIRETEKLSSREKFKRGLKRAGYDPDAGADRLLKLIARQAEERKEFEQKQKDQDKEFYKNRIKEDEPVQQDSQQPEQPKSNKLFDVLKSIGDVAIPVGRAIYGMKNRDVGADLEQEIRTRIHNKVTGEPNK